MCTITKIELHVYKKDYQQGNWSDDTGEPDWETSAENLAREWAEQVEAAFPGVEVDWETHGENESGYGNNASVRITSDCDEEDDILEYETSNDPPNHSPEMEKINEIYRKIFQNQQEKWYSQV